MPGIIILVAAIGLAIAFPPIILLYLLLLWSAK
jgi:hypothetical protein